MDEVALEERFSWEEIDHYADPHFELVTACEVCGHYGSQHYEVLGSREDCSLCDCQQFSAELVG